MYGSWIVGLLFFSVMASTIIVWRDYEDGGVGFENCKDLNMTQYSHINPTSHLTQSSRDGRDKFSAICRELGWLNKTC